jgi:hypothetical protein
MIHKYLDPPEICSVNLVSNNYPPDRGTVPDPVFATKKFQ